MGEASRPKGGITMKTHYLHDVGRVACKARAGRSSANLNSITCRKCLKKMAKWASEAIHAATEWQLDVYVRRVEVIEL